MHVRGGIVLSASGCRCLGGRHLALDAGYADQPHLHRDFRDFLGLSPAVYRALAAPLLVEFPGFSEGTSFVMGSLHAYDFFRRVVEDTGSPATLDTGHLLSYQWLRGKRGEALFDELERLPLSSRFEIHLSGCEIQGGRFFDYHHGVLLDEQLTLLQRLLPRCPRLQAITYEDPRFDAAGALVPASLPNLARLREITRGWAA